MHMVVARGGKQQSLGLRSQQFAHAGQHQMPDDFSARRAARLAGDNGAQLCGVEPGGERLDLGGLSRSLAALEGDESSALGSSFDRCLSHGQSFSAPARNAPITSSLTPSNARRIVDPLPTASAANTGASTAMLAPRQTLT